MTSHGTPCPNCGHRCIAVFVHTQKHRGKDITWTECKWCMERVDEAVRQAEKAGA